MKTPFSLLTILAITFAAIFGGCTQIQQQLQQPVTIERAARDGTVLIILTQAKTPAAQQALAGQISQVSTAMQAATQGANPDLSSIQNLIRPAVEKEIAKLNTPLAPLIELAFLDAADIADGSYVTAYASATATDKGKAAQVFLQLVLQGVQDGARLVNPSLPAPPPATQPVVSAAIFYAEALIEE